MDNILHMTYASSLTNLREINSSFDSGILRIAYTGQNRNGSFISKDVFEKCAATIYNCPIVCNYNRETDSIGGHDVDFVSDEQGMRIVNITEPLGVVPESSRIFWETVEEEDGSKHEYLCAEVLLWKRQESYRKIKEDGVTSESMEITVKEGEMRDGLFVVQDFEFTAFCLLGNDVEPCFESASLQLFSKKAVSEQFATMFRELKESFTKKPDIKGGLSAVDNKQGCETAQEKCNLEGVVKLVANTGEGRLCRLDETTKVSVYADSPKLSGVPEANFTKSAEEDGSNRDHDVSFSLASEFKSTLVSTLEREVVETEYGTTPRYYYVDHNVNNQEVYGMDANDWNLYGFKYAVNKDAVSVDFASKKRMKFDIVPFEGNEEEIVFSHLCVFTKEQYKAIQAEQRKKFQKLEQERAALSQELNALREFKATVEQESDRQAREELFAQFTDLAAVTEFGELVNDNSQYSLEELEEKCYAIRGKHQTGKFALKIPSGLPKIPVDHRDRLDKESENEPYGNIFTKYNRH